MRNATLLDINLDLQVAFEPRERAKRDCLCDPRQAVSPALATRA